MKSAALMLTAIALVATGTGYAAAQQTSNATMTLQMPRTPEPARISLDPKSTAVIVLDFVEPICGSQSKCTGQMLPAAIPFLAAARKAGVTIAYGTREPNMSRWIKDVAPMSDDVKIASMAQDRFYNTELDKTLKSKGVKTVILIGWKVSGSVTYTAVGAMVRDYTVVIPTDTTAAASDYETAIGFYNVLNSGNANLTNEALKPASTTLTRTDLVSFK